MASWLAGHGAHVVDADKLTHRLYTLDQHLKLELAHRFGDDVIQGDHVDRPTLAARVRNNPKALADLEAIVHPAVHRLEDHEIAIARTAGVPACVIEAIRIVESGGSSRCDELWIVIAQEQVQLARLRDRGVSEEDARRWIGLQGTVASWTAGFAAESARLGRARPVIVLDNSSDAAQGRALVDRLWSGVPAGLTASPEGQ